MIDWLGSQIQIKGNQFLINQLTVIKLSVYIPHHSFSSTNFSSNTQTQTQIYLIQYIYIIALAVL